MDQRKQKRQEMNRFLAKLAKLALATDQQDNLTNDKKLVYWERLRGYPIEVLEKALDLACDQCTWFPRIPELHRLVEQVGNGEALTTPMIGPERQIPELRANPETMRQALKKIMAGLEDSQ